MNKLSPNEGGCWFCHKDECDLFSWEFDCYLHENCLIEAMEEKMFMEKHCGDDPDFEYAYNGIGIIADEFKDYLIEKVPNYYE